MIVSSTSAQASIMASRFCAQISTSSSGMGSQRNSVPWVDSS
jgi:hypothetical protein